MFTLVRHLSISFRCPQHVFSVFVCCMWRGRQRKRLQNWRQISHRKFLRENVFPATTFRCKSRSAGAYPRRRQCTVFCLGGKRHNETPCTVALRKHNFEISTFRCGLNDYFWLLGCYSTCRVCWRTFRNLLSVPASGLK